MTLEEVRNLVKRAEPFLGKDVYLYSPGQLYIHNMVYCEFFEFESSVALGWNVDELTYTINGKVRAENGTIISVPLKNIVDYFDQIGKGK